MHSELSNLSLFAQMIARVLLLTGIGPGIVIAVLIRGHIYHVAAREEAFIGRCTEATKYRAQFVVLDPLRPAPRVLGKCPFPQCVRTEHGGGDHEFARIREGALVSVQTLGSMFDEQVSGRAVSREKSVTSEVLATSPLRKVRRSA